MEVSNTSLKSSVQVLAAEPLITFETTRQNEAVFRKCIGSILLQNLKGEGEPLCCSDEEPRGGI